MIPLFKTHYSIGRSILTLEEVSDQTKKRSVFALAQDAGLKEVVLVEDSLIGFLEARKKCKEYDLDLRFGLRISVSNSPDSDTDCQHKLVIFAKDSEGCKLLNKIYSNAYAYGNGVLNEDFLRENWKDQHLKLAVPFYDSFIFNNVMSFANCTPDLSFTKPTFFKEYNELPFDGMVDAEIDLYCKKNKYETARTKSIYYKNNIDFAAYQTYKCICNRGFKARTLDCPNFDHQGSNQFSFESWKKELAI